jgi:translation initiation factor 2B subunit (eIF-2B alpha/beta/delta family)
MSSTLKAQLQKLQFHDPKDAALATLKLLKTHLLKTNHGSKKKLIAEATAFLAITEKAVNEPLVFNTIKYIINNIQGKDSIHYKEHLRLKFQAAENYIQDAEAKIAKNGSSPIHKGMTIFTYGHSASVLAILIRAKKKEKNFKVHLTESRPTLQGRRMAEQLAKHNIPTTYFVDAAMRLALKDADIALLGCNAITNDQKIIAQIGSELCAETAEKFQVPLYICTNAWKVDTKNLFDFTHNTKYDQVWPYAPKTTNVDAHLYERISTNLIAGIISELGIFKPELFIAQTKKIYPFLV